MPLPTRMRLGAYEITGAIGAGGMGEVYRARDTQLNRDVAIKVVSAQLAMDPDALARFEREAMSPSVPDIEIRARRQDQFAHGAEHLGSRRRYGRGCRGPGDVACSNRS